RLAIAERPPVGGDHLAARRLEHTLSCGGVPFVGRAKARVDVGLAFGDQAEFQGRAGLDAVGDGQALVAEPDVEIAVDRVCAAGAARPWLGGCRAWMGTTAPPFSLLSAPNPVAPRHSASVAGASTMPSVGRPCSIRAMLTVNSPFLLMNSLVPSSGSTSQKGPSPIAGTRPAAISSSATTGMSGVSDRRPATMTASAAWSASVTGLLSALSRTPRSPA